MQEDIVIDPKVFIQSKIHPTVIEQIRQKMLKNPSSMRPKGNKKWQEIVSHDGANFAVNCQREDDKIAVLGVRKTRKRGPKWKKR